MDKELIKQAFQLGYKQALEDDGLIADPQLATDLGMTFGGGGTAYLAGSRLNDIRSTRKEYQNALAVAEAKLESINNRQYKGLFKGFRRKLDSFKAYKPKLDIAYNKRQLGKLKGKGRLSAAALALSIPATLYGSARIGSRVANLRSGAEKSGAEKPAAKPAAKPAGPPAKPVLPKRTVDPEFKGLGPTGHKMELGLSALSAGLLAGYRNNPALGLGKNLKRRIGLASIPLAALGGVELYGSANAKSKMRQWAKQESGFMEYLKNLDAYQKALDEYNAQQRRRHVLEVLGL